MSRIKPTMKSRDLVRLIGTDKIGRVQSIEMSSLLRNPPITEYIVRVFWLNEPRESRITLQLPENLEIVEDHEEAK